MRAVDVNMADCSNRGLPDHLKIFRYDLPLGTYVECDPDSENLSFWGNHSGGDSLLSGSYITANGSQDSPSCNATIP